MPKTFYITTAIDYPNARPHIGHAYEKTIADLFARYHRLKGEDVFFLTGTDENTQKVVESAKKANRPIKEFMDEQVESFHELLSKWSVSNDQFIRTTSDFHIRAAQESFQKAFDRGDIYKGFYEGLYCVGCETFYTEKDLVNGSLCPNHQRPVEHRSEEAYFFKLSNYRDQVLQLVKSKDFIIPESRSRDIIARLEKEPLRDLCVSRQTKEWGIPVPFDSNQAIYVWFDALLNYISAVWSETDKKKWHYWPAEVQVIGHDIAWFHTVFWPAILLSLDFPLPKHLLIHGFINDENNQKMSKSLGNVVDPFELVANLPIDSIRYYLFRETPLGNDFGFSIKVLKDRHNTELANELGNLLNRTLTLIEKNTGGKIPSGKTDQTLINSANIFSIQQKLDAFDSFNALEEIFSFVRATNKFVSEKEPWKIKDAAELDDVLYSMADALYVISILIDSFMPETSVKIREALGVHPQVSWAVLKDASENTKWFNHSGLAGCPIKKSGVLFQKLV